MAAAVKRGSGDQIIYTATGTVTEGDVIEFAGAIGIALCSGVSGDLIPLALKGEYEIDKETPLVINAGDLVYYDAANDRIDKTNTNISAGICAANAASAATRVRVSINAGSPA